MMANEQSKAKKQRKGFASELNAPAVRPGYRGSDKLKGEVAVVTGGDSGIGRSVAVHFAREGADIAVVYLESDEDAKETKKLVEAEHGRCILLKGDVSSEAFCRKVVEKTEAALGGLTILVNNAGTHEEDERLEDISARQLKRTFEVNIFSFFYLTKAALEIMPAYSTIINTTSVTAYRGSGHLLDYSSSKGAIVSFTRSLALNLSERNIRVNAVAPGPIWTPLVVQSFDDRHLDRFGKDTPMKRAGYPYEVAPAFVYLACKDSSYMTGQVLHINGGDVING